MKKVLFVAFFFPPIGTVGTQRSVKFVKYLSRKGWKVVVLSAKPTSDLVQDRELIKDIPPCVTVYRSCQIPISSFLNTLQKIRLGSISSILSKLILPDLQVGWFFPAYVKARKIINEEDINTIYTTSSPVTAHFIGLLLKKSRPSVRWIADFRDPWSLNAIMYKALGPSRRKVDRVLERMILVGCDEIVVSTESNRLNLLKSFNIKKEKVSTITNGYDEDDFTANYPQFHDEFYRITYPGSAYATYNPAHFIKAVIPLLKQNLHIKIYFVGGCSLWVHDYLTKNPMYGEYRRFFELVNRVSYKEALQFIMNSDLLLLVLPKDASAVLPGKIFEYIRSGVPILATVPPEGEAAKIIRNTQTGIVVDSENIDEISKNISICYNQWKTGKVHHIPKQGEIEKYRRDVLTEKLVRVFSG